MNPESPQFEEADDLGTDNEYQTLDNPEDMEPDVDKDAAPQTLKGSKEANVGTAVPTDVPLAFKKLFYDEGAQRSRAAKYYSHPINKKSVGPLEVNRDYSTARVRRNAGTKARRRRAQEALDAMQNARGEGTETPIEETPTTVEAPVSDQPNAKDVLRTTLPDTKLLSDEMDSLYKNEETHDTEEGNHAPPSSPMLQLLRLQMLQNIRESVYLWGIQGALHLAVGQPGPSPSVQPNMHLQQKPFEGSKMQHET
jgi:hypothetical protein